MAMRWPIFAILGLMLLTIGITLVVYAQNIPVYYAGGGTGLSMTGKVVGGLAYYCYCKYHCPSLIIPYRLT